MEYELEGLLPQEKSISRTSISRSSSPEPIELESASRRTRRFKVPRRSRIYKAFALVFLAAIVLFQWLQLWRTEVESTKLSAKKLNADFETCKKLRHKPKDPKGPGRDKNARYLSGGKPTLIRNATIWTGEADARSGVGWDWKAGDVLLDKGLISRVEVGISTKNLPEDTIIYEAEGRQLTAGIIDMHSHAGVFSLPTLDGYLDVNEASENLTPWARSIDAIFPLDHQIQVIKSGGVTTSLVLPGSANNIGGEAFLIKHAVGKDDGRPEISARDLLADTDQNWRYMKMACGENPKRVHGSLTSRPLTRMGESYDFRHAFEQARDLIQKQDDWCDKAEDVGVENMVEYLPQEIAWETLTAALRGQVHINMHCYTIPDLEAMVDHTNEFEFPVRAFHHAHQTYLVPEILKRTWGGRAPSSAIFADNMYYKTESYIGSPSAGKYLYQEGLTPVYVSDNPVLNAQHVLFEAAKGYHYGLPYHAAMASVTTAPADDLGMGDRIGKIKPGFDADIVVWDSDPLSVGATPMQVWIDGTAQFKDPVLLEKTYRGMIMPDESLQEDLVEEPREVADLLLTGVGAVMLDNQETYMLGKDESNFLSVAIKEGKVICTYECEEEFARAQAAGVETIHLNDGWVHPAFVGVGGTLGLNEIDGEPMTDNGNNMKKFTRALDGLLLDSKKLDAAFKAGVTRAISAPKYNGPGSHHGTSAGFLTNAKTSLDNDAIFEQDVAVHYSFDLLSVRDEDSYSGAFGSFRDKLMETGGIEKDLLPFAEETFLKNVLASEKTLALTINSADGIASAIRIKYELDTLNIGWGINLAIIGGAEAHLLADQLAAANVGVILTPLQSTGETWDARRTLSGAPLTNGTNIDKLLDAGVKVGIGLKEDWEVRDLAFAAGTAYRNSEGRLSLKQAVDLVGKNIYEILGVDVQTQIEEGHFVVTEGNPLEIGSRIKAVSDGKKVSLFM